MNQNLLPAAFAGAVAGGLCFGILTLVSASPAGGAASASNAPSASPGAAAADSNLDRQVQALQAEDLMLADKIAALESRLDSSGGALGSRQVVGEGVASFAPEELAALKQLAQSMPADGAPVPPDFFGSVAEVVDQLEEQEEAERDARRREMELARFDEQLVEMRAELGLDDRQSDEMRGYYMQRMDNREQIMDEVRESGDWFSIRDRMGESQDLYDAAIEGVLSPAQYEQYKEEFDRGGFPGFNPGGGRGGRGRGQ